MTSTRRRYNRSLFAVIGGRTAEDLVGLLVDEDIELLIDARRIAADSDRLESLCAEANTYYSQSPQLARLAQNPSAEPDEHHAGAAALAMRHRTCVLVETQLVADAIAQLVGLRVIDLDQSPAPIALRSP
jgi:hypothetical protein